MKGASMQVLTKTAGGFKIFSGFMGLWTTGKLSTYLTMLFLGLTVMLSGPGHELELVTRGL